MKRAFLVSLLVGINLSCQLGYQLLWAYFFGAGWKMDAFMASMTLPFILNSVITGSLAYALVPQLVEYQMNVAIKEVTSFKNTVFNELVLIGAIGTMVLYIGAKKIIYIITPGLTTETKTLAAELLQVQSLALPLMIAAGILTSYHYAEEKFYLPIVAPILGVGVASVFLVVFHHSLDIKALAWGTVTNVICQVLLLFSIMIGSYRPFIYLHHPGLLKLKKAMLPLIAGNIYSKSDVLIDRLIASFLIPGSISYLGYGQRIITAINKVTVHGLVTTRFPEMSRKAIKNIKQLQEVVNRLLEHLLFLLIPTVVCLILFLQKGVSIFFERGAFGAKDTLGVTLAVFAFIGVLVGGALGTVLANSFYSLQDTRTPALIGIFGFTLGIVLRIPGAIYFGFVGVAAATSLYYLINVIVEIIFLQKKGELIKIRELVKTSCKIFISGVIALIGGWLVRTFTPANFLFFAIGIISTLSIYLIVAYIFRIADVIKMSKKLSNCLVRS